MKRFAIIGAAGYVAPKHMDSIIDNGGEVVAALDPHDSVGILDSYSPSCRYFREPERFDRWLSKNHVDYVSVCSPNYLHDSHCLMAMRNGADVICEKPVVLNERNLDNLLLWESKTGKKINCILQCRLHHAISTLDIDGSDNIVKVVYNTPRGVWYNYSWKGDIEKSGGLPTNIGIHLFDLCVFLFGDVLDDGSLEKTSIVRKEYAFGKLTLKRAVVDWDLSISCEKASRVFRINGVDIDLTSTFNDLHKKSYFNILSGNGFGLEDARSSISIVEKIRNASR